jgi:hypothetical protein
VLFDLFGPRLALGAEALLPLEPYGRGLDLSLTADHYLHHAFDAEEAILCFCMHWSSRADGTANDAEPLRRAPSPSRKTHLYGRCSVFKAA